jgi:hypothetical protein
MIVVDLIGQLKRVDQSKSVMFKVGGVYVPLICIYQHGDQVIGKIGNAPKYKVGETRWLINMQDFQEFNSTEVEITAYHDTDINGVSYYINGAINQHIQWVYESNLSSNQKTYYKECLTKDEIKKIKKDRWKSNRLDYIRDMITMVILITIFVIFLVYALPY